MTFENKTKDEFHDNRKNIGNKQEKEANKDPQLSQAKNTGHPGETIGLVGGQPIDDKRGLDVSQYTGPGSKPSSEFNDPNAPYHQGPGSGLSQGEEAEGGEWENPEPENDSF